MWIVRLALRRPYTFIVMAILIGIMGGLSIVTTPTDSFPYINIPMVGVIWTYNGMSPDDMARRVLVVSERAMTTTVNDIERIEATAYNGVGLIRVYMQPGTNVDLAVAQVTAVSQTLLRTLPPGIFPPLIVQTDASSVPILQLGLSSGTLTEQQLYDYGQNFVRTRLSTIPGISVPLPYGGKVREVMVDLDPDALYGKGLSATDISNALNLQNLILPTGTVKVGTCEYLIRLNSSPALIAAMNDLPVKTVNGNPVYFRDIGQVRDGYQVQTNIVRINGGLSSLLTVLRHGGASTLAVVQGVKDLLPRIQATLPTSLNFTRLFDQSLFVQASVQGVVREASIAALLTALMILLFLGSWRSTLIVCISIPLSILTSLTILGLLGETINVMTLGGLALAVGILVDDATVTIENIERFLEEGHDLHTAILDGAGQIAVPALVSTLCICIVFLPMFFLGGVARYLFVPLAEAVVFAMLASYILSRTLVPTLAMYLLKAKQHDRASSRNPLVRFQLAFERGFERLRNAYHSLLTSFVHRRGFFIPAFLLTCLAAFLLVPWLGQDFFPNTDSGQFILHLRAKSGTRIEETAKLCDLVEGTIRHEIPEREVDNILDNIGLPYSSINYMHSISGLIGAGDADILVSLKEGHHSTADYVERLREALPREYPGTTFYFVPADIVTQVLNF